MSPELKQRLIGAAVVTALATIFIPMLFDDPVDNSGQSVNALTIPAAPIKSNEVSANKLPTPANKVGKANPDEEATDAEMVDDADAEANAEPPVNETASPSQADVGNDAEQPPADEETLDTGVVPEAKAPVKKAVEKPKTTEPEVELTTVKNTAKKPEGNTPKLLPTSKPAIKPVVVEKPVVDAPPPVKPAVKKPEVTVAKAVGASPKPAATPVSVPTEKPAKNPELVRYSILAGSFGQKDNATTLMKSLREQGIPVNIESKGSMFQLKIGPSLDKKKAAAYKAKLDKQGVSSMLMPE